MLPSLAEIVFNCPLCTGPLIARAFDAGRTTECPHCYQPFAIPAKEGKVVNKDTFAEPPGLRRILKEVRDNELEALRRKWQDARRQAIALELEVKRLREENAAAAGAPESETGRLAESLESLRNEVAPLREENAEMLRQVIAIRAALDSERQEHRATKEELARLRARHTGRRTPFPSVSPVRS